MTLCPGRRSAPSPSRSTDVAAIHAPVLPDEHSPEQSSQHEGLRSALSVVYSTHNICLHVYLTASMPATACLLI